LLFGPKADILKRPHPFVYEVCLLYERKCGTHSGHDVAIHLPICWPVLFRFSSSLLLF
jgi:hypothetical protein